MRLSFHPNLKLGPHLACGAHMHACQLIKAMEGPIMNLGSAKNYPYHKIILT